MDHAIQIVILLLFLLHRRTLTDYSPEILPSAACSDKLVTFSSSCLPFIAVFPHNLTGFPPPQCCEEFSAAVGGDSAVCLLYAALQQRIVEFPIDSTKLLYLASVCPLKDRKPKARISNETLCSGLEFENLDMWNCDEIANWFFFFYLLFCSPIWLRMCNLMELPLIWSI